MTAPVPPPLAADASTAAVFRRAAAAEWTRLRTVRATWWALLAAAGLMLSLGAAIGADHTGGDPAPVWYAAQFAIVPGQFAFLLVVLFAATGEYTTGAIRSSLQWVPRRAVLLAVRILVPAAFVVGCAILVSVATDLVAWVFLGQAADVDAGAVAGSLVRIALVIAFGSVLTVGVGLLLRSTAGTLTAIFLLVFALPVVLGNSGVPWLTTVSDHLPGRAIVAVLVVDGVDMAASTVATVMIGWATAAVFAGGWSLLRRDTT